VRDREELYQLFLEVERSMEAEGVRASSEKVREFLVKVLYTFCNQLGEDFFKNLVEAELRLVKELEHFILYGIVDAVKSQGEEYEIWDYKAMRVPNPKEPLGKVKLERYSQQLFVYGYLFKERNGFYPKRAVLFFLNELLFSPKEECLIVVDFSEKEVQERAESYLEELKRIVSEIEKSKESNQWALPQEPDINTCKQCDFRWDCEKFKGLEEL
jgi:putative RecB family exonuclease